MIISREEFEKVYDEVEYKNVPLNLVHIHKIFGEKFFELMILCLTDARASGMELQKLLDETRKNND